MLLLRGSIVKTAYCGCLALFVFSHRPAHAQEAECDAVMSVEATCTNVRIGCKGMPLTYQECGGNPGTQTCQPTTKTIQCCAQNMTVRWATYTGPCANNPCVAQSSGPLIGKPRNEIDIAGKTPILSLEPTASNIPIFNAARPSANALEPTRQRSNASSSQAIHQVVATEAQVNVPHRNPASSAPDANIATGFVPTSVIKATHVNSDGGVK